LYHGKIDLSSGSSRGKIDLGWVISYPTFCFGNYYNPERISFGALRVLNDDVLKGGEGFGDHPHTVPNITIRLDYYGNMIDMQIVPDGEKFGLFYRDQLIAESPTMRNGDKFPVKVCPVLLLKVL
jgi:hypothetical protein